LHRASLVALVAAVAAAALTGCSESNPTASTVGDWGSLSGNVISDRGAPVADIEIHLWAEVGAGRTIAQYDAVTDASGDYEIEDIDLSRISGSSHEYEFYANRTKSSALPVNAGYATYVASVTIEKGESTTMNVVIADEGPVLPEQYFD
jgi:hypothetical protein